MPNTTSVTIRIYTDDVGEMEVTSSGKQELSSQICHAIRAQGEPRPDCLLAEMVNDLLGSHNPGAYEYFKNHNIAVDDLIHAAQRIIGGWREHDKKRDANPGAYVSAMKTDD